MTNFLITAESVTQAISEARIIAVRLISFVKKGDSVRVNMAFRVRTVLEDQEDKEPMRKNLYITAKTKNRFIKMILYRKLNQSRHRKCQLIQ